MARLQLPPPAPAPALLFSDSAGARDWIAGQPLVTPEQMVDLLGQIRAVDADASLALGERFLILAVLRSAVIRAQSGLEARYTHKALPPGSDAAQSFALSRDLWRALSIAHLRMVPGLPPNKAVVPLHRAAVTLRLEHFAHVLARHDIPTALNRLLYDVLTSAEEFSVLRSPVSDPDFDYLGESVLAGHVAWAWLLAAVDPYGLSLAQLTVANRAFSRWKDLAGFQGMQDDDPKARIIALHSLLPGVPLAEGGPRWIETRAVVRKIRRRVEALEGGESPESLKLGRDLTTPACIDLLRRLDLGLKRSGSGGFPESRPVTLAFGPENVYVALERRPLNPVGLDAGSSAKNHERMAIFGFDNVANLNGAVSRAQVTGETWQLAGDRVVRLRGGASRHQPPCLVALAADNPAAVQIGVLHSLKLTEDGCLSGAIRWYPEQALAARLRRAGPMAAKAPRVSAFVLPDEASGTFSLILPPTAGVRSDSAIALDDSPVEHVRVGEVLERGSDFVRYACQTN